LQLGCIILIFATLFHLERKAILVRNDLQYRYSSAQESFYVYFKIYTNIKIIKMNNFKILFIALAAIAAAIALSLSSCKKDPEDVNEEEVITTLNYTLAGGGSTVTLSFQDLDGDGGDAPTITGGTLAANTTYSGSIELLNEIEGEDITEEIEEEDEDHQFFFEATNGISITYDDADADGNPSKYFDNRCSR